MNQDGRALSDEIERKVRPVIDSYLKRGAKGRDIENVIHSTVAAMVAEAVLRQAVAARKAARSRG